MIVRFGCVAAMAIIVSGCTTMRDRHGYVIERGETELEAAAGIDTKESVLARYGEPSVRPAIGDETWYYISANTKNRAFYNEQTTSRTIVAFNFDQDGVVTNIDEYTLEDGEKINLVDRVTRTRGKELSFLEQLVGGVGQLPGAVDPDGPTP